MWIDIYICLGMLALLIKNRLIRVMNNKMNDEFFFAAFDMFSTSSQSISRHLGKASVSRLVYLPSGEDNS